MKQTLLLLLVLFVCGISSHAQTKIDGIYYNLDNNSGTAAVTYRYDGTWSDNGRNTAKNTQEYSGDIVIPETVKYNGRTYTVTGIAEYAFYGNDKLNSITIPKTVTTIGDYAMSWCAGLTAIIVDPDNNNYCSEDGVLFTEDMKTLVQYPENKQDVSYVIPNGVEVLGPDAFQGCNNLASITIPEGINNIRDYVFQDCQKLTSVTLPSTLTNIEQLAFNKCVNLKEITFLSPTPPTIKNDSFNQVTNVTINVPQGSEDEYAKLGIGGNTGSIVSKAYTIKTIGDNCSIKGAGAYSYKQEVELHVTPNTGYYFVRWSDGNTDNPRTIVVLDNATYEAIMEKGDYQINVVADGQGTVTGKGTYEFQDEVTLTATPLEGYIFDKWQDGNTDNPRKIIVEGNATYTATFKIGTYNVTLSAIGNGTVLGAGKYNYNEKATIKATPDAHYHFVKWSDDDTNSERTITVKKDVSLSATFAIDKHTITVDKIGEGSVSGGGEYDYNADATLNAEPAEHYHFVEWNDNVTDAQRAVKVLGNATYTATFAINQHTLTVTSNGNGTVSGGGTYNYGAKATLKATAEDNYHFVKWSDGNTNATREVTVNGDATYTATFAINQHTLTVTSNGNGTVTGGGTYDYGKKVTIKATADANYHFVKWSDGNTNATREVTVNGNATYTATFAINQHTLTVTSNGNGTVSGGGTYNYGAKATLKATAEDNYHFVKWSDGNTNATREVTVNGDATYTATFAINQHTLTVTSNGNGTVSGGGTYDYGTKVIIKATADDNYHFVKWSDGNTNATREVTVEADATYTATFAINQHTLTVTSNGNGTVTGGGTYDYGTKVTLKATADDNYHFVKWSDDNTNATREVTVNGNATYTATFAINQHTLTVTSNGNGTVSGGGTYDYGTKVTIKATANDNYHFVKWSDGETNATREVTVEADATYTATFAINQHTLTVTSNGNGTVSGGGTYNYGTKATLKAIADDNYHFVKWSDGNTNATREVTVNGDATYTATFAINQHTLTVTSNGNGTVSGGGTYDYGKKVTIKATADANYHFVKWSDGDTNATREVTVEADATYTATFAINQHTLNVTSNGNGTVSGGGTYDYGTKVTIKATANDNYHFVKWSDGETNATREVTVEADATYTATFAINQHTLTVTSNGNGTVLGSGTYDYGTKVTIKATAEDNYHFVKWSDGNTNATREVTVEADATYTATFAVDQYTISATTDDNGTVSGAGSYGYGSTATLVATPKTGYYFAGWSDGDKTNPRSVEVLGNATYIATFALGQFTLDVTCNEGGKVVGGGTYKYGDKAKLVATPDEHYHLVSWSTGATTEEIEVVVGKDMSVSATFAIDMHKVTVLGDSRGTVEGTNTYAYGSVATIKANPKNGYEFDGWSDGVVDNPRQVEVLSDCTFEAKFKTKKFTLTLKVDGLGDVEGAGEYDYNTKVTIVAKDDAHSKFLKWNDGVSTKSREVTMTSDMTLTAKFETNKYTVNFVAGDNGKVSAKGGSYVYGKNLTITATPYTGYKFDKWSDGDTNAKRTFIVEENATYTALFVEQTYNVDVVVEGRGSVEGTGEYTYNSEVVLTATAADEYSKFVKWSDGETSATRTFTVTSDVKLTAVFENVTFGVNIYSANELGSVDGGGAFEAEYGSKVTVTAVANVGARFVEWSDGSEEVTRTIEVLSDIELVAYFEEISDVTAIEDVTAEVIVKVVGNAVVVEGAEEFAVYDLRGMRYYQTNNLPRGIFVVVVGNTTHKVYVK